MSGDLSFVYDGHPAHVVFAPGAVDRVDVEVDRLGVTRALVIGAADRTARVVERLGTRAVGSHSEVVMHVPIECVRVASELTARLGADGLVTIGGGSAVGLAKALARESGLPILAIPTTYAGSEMTAVWGITEGGQKRTGRDPRVRPRTVLYDPDLTRTLGPDVAGPSGLNAIAHAMEALYAPSVDPITMLLAEESVRAFAIHLPRLAASADDATRAGALYGAWLAGVCLDQAAMGLHHKLCHVLGGTFGLPHGAVHGVILPQAAAYNREAAPEAMRRLARALGVDDAPRGLFDLAVKVGAPTSLAALGMRETDLDRAADLVTQSPYANPRPVDRESLRALLAHAFAGSRP